MKGGFVRVWLLLATALLIITVVSFAEKPSLFGLELKQSGVAKTLVKEPESIDSGLLAISAPPVSETAKKAAPDTASQRILIIGDSMLEGLNPRLAAYARENGHTLNSVIWYSSTTKYWGESDTLKVFIRRFNPTYIFISLGANELFVRNIADHREALLKNFLRQIGDIPYVWIGPPNWKKDTGINEMIARNVPKGRFFCSNGMHFDRKADGAHPTHASASLWMDSIARWMTLHADHPIKMKKPKASKAAPNSVTVLQPLK